MGPVCRATVNSSCDDNGTAVRRGELLVVGCPLVCWQGLRVALEQHPGMGRGERQPCIPGSYLLSRAGAGQPTAMRRASFGMIQFNERGRLEGTTPEEHWPEKAWKGWQHHAGRSPAGAEAMSCITSPWAEPWKLCGFSGSFRTHIMCSFLTLQRNYKPCWKIILPRTAGFVFKTKLGFIS